jgi:hypothetical protein
MGDAGRMGTLRQALLTSIDTVLHVAIATAVARVDRNFNLRVLASGGVRGASGVPVARPMQSRVDLWFTLAALRERARCVLGAVEARSTVAAANDGLHGPHSCRFPFSHALVALLEEQRKELTLNLKSGGAVGQRLRDGAGGDSPPRALSGGDGAVTAAHTVPAERLDAVLPLVLGQAVADAVSGFFASDPVAACDA